MRCPQCGNEVIVESAGNGHLVKVCQKCGWRRVEDKRGTGLLTDDVPVNPQRLLTEGA